MGQGHRRLSFAARAPISAVDDQGRRPNQQMKWYRDKKWLVGTILALVGIFVSVGTWLFAKSSNQNSIGTISGNSGAVAQGNYNVINAAPRHSFSSVQTINTLPPKLGGKSVLNLDNVGTLRLFVPDSIDQATLVLDTIPMKFPDQGIFTDIHQYRTKVHI
jgi:hypothetical protein